MDEIEDKTILNGYFLRDNSFEEMQEIVGRPNSVLHWTYAILVSLVFFGAIAFFSSFECRDIIPTNVQITNTVPVVSIMTTRSGYVKRVFVSNGETVEKNAPLLTFADASEYQSVQIRKELVQAWIDNSIKREQLRKRFMEASDVAGELQMSFSSYGMQLSAPNIDDESLKYLSLNLLSEIGLWMSRYVLFSPISGQICYIPGVGENLYLNAGSLLGRVIPKEKGRVVGKAMLAASYRSRIEIGSKCIIELPPYPSEDYGQLEGVVEQISSVAIVDGTYLVDISFPNGLVTNVGREISEVDELIGTASIVATNQKLGNLVLNPLRKIFRK